VYTSAAAHLVVDVAGFVPAGAEGIGRTVPLRLFDSRPDNRFTDGQVVEVQVAGRGPIPADATAALLNVAIVLPDGPGHVSLTPCTGGPVATSNLNHGPGTLLRANNTITQLSERGTVCVYSYRGAHIVVDITGWLTP